MAKTLSTMLDLGSKATAFSLPDTNPKTLSRSELSDFSFATDSSAHKGFLISFICNHCPFVVHIIEPFSEVLNKAQSNGIKTVAISSNDVATHPADSPEKMSDFADQYKFEFPYCYDDDQSVAKTYTAACTPDFFLFNAQSELVYRGQFDSSRPGNGIAVTGEDLHAAINALCSGEPINADQSASMGCNIKWKSNNSPQYFS